MLPQNWGEPAIFEKQIEIKLLHSGVTDSGYNNEPVGRLKNRLFSLRIVKQSG
ncbi:MAG: hypothetical protein P8X89_15300 [Reinekea sp.]